jgi:hypothetical protein
MTFSEPKPIQLGFSGRLCFRNRGIPTKAPAFVIHLDQCPPLTGVLTPVNTGDAACVVLRQAFVLVIDGIGDRQQIIEPVVTSVAIDVVNLVSRPLAMDDCPGNPVGAKIDSGDCPNPITGAVRRRERFRLSPLGVPGITSPLRSSNATTVGTVLKHARRTRLPEQFAGLWLIAEQLAAQVRGDIGSASHGAALSRGGKGRAVLVAPLRPAFSA